jgi:hypothetical protein
MRGADMRGADMSGANMRGADMSGANMSEANMRGADMSDADMRGADMSGANMRGANMSEANMRDADMRGADMSGADMRGANMSGANMSEANMRGANMRGANMRDADMRGADMRDADMRGADMSGASGILAASLYIAPFERCADGIIVYRWERGCNAAPAGWFFAPGMVISESGINPDRCTECGSGVNFATRQWCKKTDISHSGPLWKCLIPWAQVADVVVPFHTDGKARCRMLVLLNTVEGK